MRQNIHELEFRLDKYNNCISPSSSLLFFCVFRQVSSCYSFNFTFLGPTLFYLGRFQVQGTFHYIQSTSKCKKLVFYDQSEIILRKFQRPANCSVCLFMSYNAFSSSIEIVSIFFPLALVNHFLKLSLQENILLSHP